MSQGSKANITGTVLENIVTSSLNAHGFELVPAIKYAKHPDNYGSELLLRNMPYKTLYGSNGHTEFLLISEKHNLNIRIECKWQQSAGSVDEKLPYLYLSCVEAMPEDEIIILIDGDGFRGGAKEWLKEAATSRRYIPASNTTKIIHVFNSTEFMTWVNDTFS